MVERRVSQRLAETRWTWKKTKSLDVKSRRTFEIRVHTRGRQVSVHLQFAFHLNQHRLSTLLPFWSHSDHFQDGQLD